MCEKGEKKVRLFTVKYAECLSNKAENTIFVF